ncbi:hypothetical protein RKD23_000027 [Streptomyces sp. SAI-170]
MTTAAARVGPGSRAGPRPSRTYIYGSLYPKAAALLQALAKLPRLEHSNERFAWHSTEAYLILNARELGYPPKAALALVRDAASLALGVARTPPATRLDHQLNVPRGACVRSKGCRRTDQDIPRVRAVTRQDRADAVDRERAGRLLPDVALESI